MYQALGPGLSIQDPFELLNSQASTISRKFKFQRKKHHIEERRCQDQRSRKVTVSGWRAILDMTMVILRDHPALGHLSEEQWWAPPMTPPNSP